MKPLAANALKGFLLLWFGCAFGAGTVTEQGLLVHYSAINSNSLGEDVARQYGIERRKSHAIILLSPRRQMDSAIQGKAISAVASGVVRRLTGQRQTLRWRTIEVSGQQDLIAEFEIQNGEKLNFDISVKPAGAAYPLQIRFLQQFYRE